MMTITFLTGTNFDKVEGSRKNFHAGFGTGRNISFIKKDNNGRIYACLSPIADPSYNGISCNIQNERVINQINATLKTK